MSKNNDKDSGDFIGHFPCIANECDGKKDCGSSDAMAVYEHEDEDGEVHYDAHCYSCWQTFKKEDLYESEVAVDLGIKDGEVVSRKKFTKKPKAEPMTLKDAKAFISSMGYASKGYRGIKDEYNKFYGHLTRLNNDGKVLASYYPETRKGTITGYKSRIHPKKFGYDNKGLTGINSDLSGQVKFKSGGRYLLIVGGEADKVAAYQMFAENRKDKEYDPIAVVSPTTGESSAFKQISEQYEFCDSFEEIILGFDNDEAGIEAAKNVAEVLPENKVRIATWSHKDPNNMLVKDKHKQFLSDFYNARDFINSGVKSAVEADAEMEEELARPKISLPPFQSKLQSLFAGGIPLGYIVNIISVTGSGKSTIVNENIRHWIYNSPYKVGILSLELNCGQYMTAMLSREIGYKIQLIEDPKEAVAYVQQPHVVESRRKLTTDDNGESRFALIDDREGTLKSVKKQIEVLVKKHRCKLIVIDPLQDLFEGVSYDEQLSFVKWMKGVIKNGVSLVNVCHVRKSGNTTDKNGKRIMRELTEDDVHGIGSITKAAGANIFCMRDKYAECDIERNVTYITLGKCRWTGLTGEAGKWYYDNPKHTMYDYDTHFNDAPKSDANEDYDDYIEEEITPEF